VNDAAIDEDAVAEGGFEGGITGDYEGTVGGDGGTEAGVHGGSGFGAEEAFDGGDRLGCE